MSTHFSSVTCGVDGSPEGLAAARLAAHVAAPGSTVTLVAVQDLSVAINAGWGATAIADQLASDSLHALDAASAELEPATPVERRQLEGDPAQQLVDELRSSGASLVVVGTHGVRRAVGILLGSVATTLLHDAPCSVLVSRAGGDLARWPRSIVVGVDGSETSAAAVEAARELAERFGAPLRGVAAADADLDAARAQFPDLEELDGSALDVLVVLSESADLVVLGSRGLKGVRALGSVSERVAHEARSSVLVVRGR